MFSIALVQGDRALIDVTVVRDDGVSGPISLALDGVPAGVAVDVAANPVAGSDARLSIGVADATRPGTYPLTLRGAGDGISAEALPLELHVVQRVPQPVMVRYCVGTEPSWVAFQDGNGVWTHVDPTVSGDTITFRSDLSTDRGAVATAYSYSGFTSVAVWYGTVAELPLVGDTNPRYCGPATSKTLFGTVAGLDADEFAVINTGSGSRARAFPEQGGDFVINAAPGGSQDFLATRSSPENGNATITGMILRRSVDAPDGTTLPTFDFTGSEAFAPAVATVSVQGIGPEGASGSTGLLTSHDQLAVSGLTNQGTDFTRQFVALPEAELLPEDLQVLFVTANPTVVGGGRTATLYFRSPTDRTLILGAPLLPPTFITVDTEPALRVRAQFEAQSDYDRSAGVSLQQGAGTIVSINMTAAYAGLAGRGYDILVPDLSHAAGYDPAWALRPEGTLIWVAGRIGGTLGLGLNAMPSNGATQRATSAAGTILAR